MSNSAMPPSIGTDAAQRESQASGLTSVDNALRLIELVGNHQELRVAEAADLLGVARSTAHRLLTTLRQRNFVMQDRPNGVYRPGPALQAIGFAAARQIDVREVAQPLLEQLSEKTLETITLAVLDRQHVRFIASVESPRPVRVGNRTGVTRLAHASAVGKAMLAELTLAEINERYPSDTLPESTAATITEKKELIEELDSVRAMGYALNWGESLDEVSAIAVSVRDRAGSPVVALGLAAPTSRMGSIDAIRGFAPDLKETAREIHWLLAKVI